MASGEHYRGKTVMERHSQIQVKDTPSNLPSTTSIHCPKCILCHQPIDVGNPIVSTSIGDLIHIACADRDALAAAQQRQRQALIYGAGLPLVGLMLLALVHLLLGLLLLLVFAMLHVRLNTVWWRHIAWRLCRAL
jgi:hypothetical protein